jgi:oligopeptide/dipeptide ABC transporter ATP-binding protein
MTPDSAQQSAVTSQQSPVTRQPPLLEVRDLRKEYAARSGLFSSARKMIRAVEGVSFAVQPGETLGIVGESGSGKSTLVKCLLFLEQPTAGEILFEGVRLTQEEVTRLRRHAQIVFQDPYMSLPPRMRVGDIIADPLRIHGLASGQALAARVRRLLDDVGLQADAVHRYPHEFSGGQRQRIGIARALAVEPTLLVADEAVSSLDVSVQAQILNLFKELQARHNLTYLFVSHDLGVVKYMSHRIAVMHLGEIVELGQADSVYARPLHPYTRVLLSAVPRLHRGRQGGGQERIRLRGDPPSPANPPSGCKFHTRCPMAQPICAQTAPTLHEWLPGRQAACHFALDALPSEKLFERVDA